MPSPKRLTDLQQYKGVLPYSSELFGVYQPMIGWKSKRILTWLAKASESGGQRLIDRLIPHFQNRAPIRLNADCAVEVDHLAPATFSGPRLAEQDSPLLQQVAADLAGLGAFPGLDDWRKLLEPDRLTRRLAVVLEEIATRSINVCRALSAMDRSSPAMVALGRARNESAVRQSLSRETQIAGALAELAKLGRSDMLERIFYVDLDRDGKAGFHDLLQALDIGFKDPFLTFDPQKDISQVTLSPIGVTHLFRQYFFELDTFLGTPVGHVWLSPGSSVELVEVSTRRTLVEKTYEQSTETTQKQESSVTAQDEISEAIKQENREDLKLGVTTTVNQSWGSGNITATASLNLDKSQQVARETTHKRMREQSDKLSFEIRQNYKSTLRTVTETTDQSSKRYVLANTTDKLINYELRRKMRQVAVQVQDIGAYLCWDTYVDEPGEDLGLANLVHLAEPADLLPVPDQTAIPYPADQVVTFRANATWNWGDSRRFGFVPLTLIEQPPAPAGYEAVITPDPIRVTQISGSGEDFEGSWAFEGRFTPAGQIELGVVTAPGGLEWDERVDFVLGGAIVVRASDAKRAEIDAANAARVKAATDASAANDRKTKDAFRKAAKERIELAGAVTRRKFEDLREEERTIVYRRLIRSLMTASQYASVDDRSRHVLSQLLNTIFDIDKMLYFVAPEWWKPRQHKHLSLSINDVDSLLNDSVVTWDDQKKRQDNYLITDKSLPAPKGASLGWLLQLDGDDMRNAFLNAPWVKAVIPVRPGREQAAVNWLRKAGVEGADGLDAAYAADEAELAAIRDALGLAPGTVVSLQHAIDWLCKRVAEKHAQSNEVKPWPATEIDDSNKVLATPIEKVYEHGFYPLQGGFRVNPVSGGGDPNNTDPNFQIFDQWTEVLPTDQMVPVPVSYNPITGRQE